MEHGIREIEKISLVVVPLSHGVDGQVLMVDAPVLVTVVSGISVVASVLSGCVVTITSSVIKVGGVGKIVVGASVGRLTDTVEVGVATVVGTVASVASGVWRSVTGVVVGPAVVSVSTVAASVV